MAKVIAVAGKGGVGKTTLCGLLIQYLCDIGKGPVLAVDADANSNLNEVLGVEEGITLGEIRDELENAAEHNTIPAGVDKNVYTEMRLNAALSEDDDFDLLIMGRSQGKGCYCYVNSLLERQVQKLQGSYPYIVVDNEAGMEHLNRGILPQIDVALLVSDCSRRGIQATARIADLIDQMDVTPKTVGLIVNRAPDGVLSEDTAEEIRSKGLNLIGVVPQDDQVYKFDCAGKPLVQLAEDSPVKQALRSIVESLNL